MKKNVLIIGAALAASSACALADGVTLTYDGQGDNGALVSVALNGGLFFENGASNASLWAGELLHSVEGNQITTYCTELTQWVGSDEYCVLALEDAPIPGSGMGAEKAEAIYRLYNATNDASDVDSDNKAVAFQAVIWEIVYEYEGSESDLNLFAGNVEFTGVNSAWFDTYADFASDPNGDDSPRVIAYGSETSQDQLAIVPLPSVAALAGVGLAGLVGRRQR